MGTLTISWCPSSPSTVRTAAVRRTEPVLRLQLLVLDEAHTRIAEMFIFRTKLHPTADVALDACRGLLPLLGHWRSGNSEASGGKKKNPSRTPK